jgi:transcriptional regulator with XRE-family HTH domain
MAITPLKSKLGETLRAILNASVIRQKDIAKALDISCSAVSQMLSGKIVPSHRQLETIFEMTCADRDLAMETEALLYRIRNGDRTLRSAFNQQFMSARRMTGLDIGKLSARSGIAVSRLNMLENNLDAIATVEEINKLSPLLKWPVEDMLLAAGLARPMVDGESLSVAEPAAEYRTMRRTLPVLELSQLRDFRPGEENLFNFAMRHASRQTERGANLPVPAVAVVASCRELKMGVGGEVILLLSETRPEGYREVDLIRDRLGRMRVRERQRGCLRVLQSQSAHAKVGYAKWSLPVLEMVLRPVRAGRNEVD